MIAKAVGLLVLIPAIFTSAAPLPAALPTPVRLGVTQQVVSDAAHSDRLTPAVRPVVKHHHHKKHRPRFRYTPTAWDLTVRKCIIQRESNGIVHLRPNYASASGLYQFIDSTWHHFKGYPQAWMAPESVQTMRFWMIWQHGKGRMNWYYAGHKQCW